MGHGLAEAGEMGCFWVCKDLEEFGLKQGLFLLKEEVLYYIKSYVKFQTTTKDGSGADLAKTGRFHNIVHLSLTPSLHHETRNTGTEPRGSTEHSLRTTGMFCGLR